MSIKGAKTMTGVPRVIADGPLAESVIQQMAGDIELLPWEAAMGEAASSAAALYTYGHPRVDAAMLDRLPTLKVISNYGVGVDHIDLAAAKERGIPVGNTPGILDGATADMAFTLLLAAARRLIEGDRYARSPQFTSYDPGYMLGVEVHGQTLGIVGMGRIGSQVAQRARGFDMRVLYCNRRERPDATSYGAERASLDRLLSESDFVVLTVPLSDETRGLIGHEQLRRMKSTAILVNVARGPVVDTAALTEALQQRWIYAAAVDVTDPEPLPRGHPLLSCDNLTIAPHLGSATQQTRQKMAEISVENLIRGLAGKNLLHRVV
jgi:glyoxylate reductase